MRRAARGLRLERRARGEWDERVLLYTREYGLLEADSFGSRSPKSDRGALLAGLDWLDFTLEQRAGAWRLLGAQLAQANPVGRDGSDPAWFLEAMGVLLRTVPKEAPDGFLFHLVRITGMADWTDIDPAERLSAFLYGLLQVQGRTPPAEDWPPSLRPFLRTPPLVQGAGAAWPRIAGLRATALPAGDRPALRLHLLRLVTEPD